MHHPKKGLTIMIYKLALVREEINLWHNKLLNKTNTLGSVT